MPRYQYAAKTKSGKAERGYLSVPTQEDAVARLRAQGLFVVSVDEVKEGVAAPSLFSSLFARRGKRSSIKVHDLAFFARNLATTLSSGVTLLRSLEILSKQAESAKLEKILKSCVNYIQEGLSLNEALLKFPGVFSALWRGLVEVGEASGNLPFVLDKLADYLEMRVAFERKVKSALVYPAILMVVATLACFGFFKFILPKFTMLFEQFDIELPLPTKIMFGMSKFMENHSFLVLAGMALVVAGCYIFIKQPTTKKIWERMQLKLPIFGQLVYLTCLERLTSTIYILLDSGLPLVYTLEVASRGIGNSMLEKNLLAITNRVRGGSSLSDEFSRLHIFPLLISEMAKIGEETGTMPQVFQKISSHYQKEVSTRIDRLITAFEPIMIVAIGVVIGGIVISLFLPLFKLSTLGG